MIVVAIIVIMSAIVLSYLDSAKKKGRDAIRIGDIKQIEQALEVYFDSCSEYPTPVSNKLPASLATDCGGNKLPKVPTDPKTSEGWYYGYGLLSNPPDGQSIKYHICARLELGYAGGIGRAGADPLNGSDPCNGKASDIFDLMGP